MHTNASISVHYSFTAHIGWLHIPVPTYWQHTPGAYDLVGEHLCSEPTDNKTKFSEHVTAHEKHP